MRCYRTDQSARYRDRLALKAEDDGLDWFHYQTRQDTTFCTPKGESVARLGGLSFQPRRLARPFTVQVV